MESFDQSLKYLLHRKPAEFIGFGLGESAIQVLEPVPSGLPARGRDVDGAYLIARGTPEPSGHVADADKRIVHIELHRRHQRLEELAVDIAKAQLRLFRRERRLIISQVWDLYGDATAPVLEQRTLDYGEAGSRCVYQRVNLRGMGWQELLSRGPAALWPLVALTRDGASEAVIKRARDAIEARSEWSSAERADYLAVLWFVAEAEDVPAKLLRAYLSEGRLMESELYKSIFEKGEAKGEAKAYKETLVRMLIHQLGTLDIAVRERIGAMSDLEVLKAWHSEALFAADAEGVRRLVDKIQRV